MIWIMNEYIHHKCTFQFYAAARQTDTFDGYICILAVYRFVRWIFDGGGNGNGKT